MKKLTAEKMAELIMFETIRNVAVLPNLAGKETISYINAVAYQTVQECKSCIDTKKALEDYEDGRKTYEEVHRTKRA